MRYRNYKLNMETIAQAIRKHRLVKGKGLETTRQALRLVVSDRPEYVYTLDFVIQCEEHLWLQDKVCYYPESLELAESLVRASTKLYNSQAVFTGQRESFVLCPPIDLRIARQPSAAFLVTIIPNEERGSDMIDPYFDWLQIRKVPVKEETRGDFSLSVSYQFPGHGVCEYTRFTLTSDVLDQFMKVQSLEEWKALMDGINDFGYFMGEELTPEDEVYQYNVLKYIANFLLYKKAKPERVREGLPGVSRKEVETPTTLNRSHHVISAPTTGNGVTRQAHYRSWHFRQLMAPRFYQGEHKDKPIGSRVVFVSDSMVGREDASPYTVESA